MKLRHIITAGLVAVASVGLVLSSHTTTRVGPASYYPPSDIVGVTNPNVTQANIHQTICISGWTATIRPSSSYTTDLKKYQLGIVGKNPLDDGYAGVMLYGFGQYAGADKNTANFEEDHLISLELGGHPTDTHNLWPEAYPTAHLKDQTENALKRAVCSGSLTLKEAQDTITGDWYKYYLSIKPSFGAVQAVDSADSDDE